MTSKEYIKGVLYNMEDLLKQAKTDNCKSVIIDCEDEIMHYNQIIKDLDELEEYRKIMGTPIQEIMEKIRKLEYYENEQYKHWNIFFNGAKLEYLLYLEEKGKESFMTSISEELFSKIHKHFLE